MRLMLISAAGTRMDVRWQVLIIPITTNTLLVVIKMSGVCIFT